MRDDYSKSIADRALKFAHELDNCINSYNLEDHRSTVVSFPVVAFVSTLRDTEIFDMRDIILTMANGNRIEKNNF